MSTVNSNIQIGKKDAAFFAANPTLVLLDGQLIYNEDTGDLFIGDGTTQLSALTAINGGSGSYTFENGLTESLGTVVLGGDLTGNTGVGGANTWSFYFGNGFGGNLVNLEFNATNVKLPTENANALLYSDNDNAIRGLVLSANQSIRRNAGNTAFEAYTPSGGGSVVIKSTTVSAAHTGTLTNTIVHSQLIPAGSFTVDDIIEYMVCSAKRTSNTFTIRVYVNTVNSLSGATLISTYGAGTSAGVYYHARIGAIVGAADTQMYPTSTSFLGRDAQVAGANIASVNIDWTVDQYFIVAHQLNNIVDSTTFRSLYVLKR